MKKRRCESDGCKGLMQRLDIRVANISQEKQMESPTQTSLSATEAQRLTQGHGGELSQTQHKLKLENVNEVFFTLTVWLFSFKRKKSCFCPLFVSTTVLYLQTKA